MKIYLCDLTHTAQGYTSELVPYAIGCIRSYLLTKTEAEVELFKEIPLLDEAMARNTPDIVGLSNYLWNSNLSLAVAERIKAAHPDMLVVFGGPNFPLESEAQERWMLDHSQVDAYVLGEGEVPFAEIVRAYEGEGIDGVREASIYGVCTLEEGRLRKNVTLFDDGTDMQPRMMDLEAIPSPYLNGSMDPFLAHPMFIPVLSCNRGCPFSCTYCVAGISACTRVVRRSVEDVVRDLEYIVPRFAGHTLHLVDANFGMYPEDVEISKAIGTIKGRTGYPKWIIVATGKNRKERVREVSDRLTGSLRVAASVQSMDPTVLKLIKRENIDREELLDLARHCDSDTYSEMIMPLPGETPGGYINGVCELIDMGFGQLRLHQLVLLPGSEMETAQQRALHGFRTRHRVLQRSYGRYVFMGSEMTVAETEEVVVGHDTFTLDDYLDCRAFALTVALFFNDGVFAELAAFLRVQGVSHSDFLQFVHEELRSRLVSSLVLDTFTAFVEAAQGELFADRQALDVTVQKDGGAALDTEWIGNNLLYNTQGYVLAHHFPDLCGYAFGAARALLDQRPNGWRDSAGYLDELELYCLAKKGHVVRLDAVEEVVFHYDFVTQEANGFASIPQRQESVRARFVFEPWQKELFAGQIAKYGSDARGLGKVVARSNMSQTYRRMEVV